jgi:hypothetical protein
VDAATRTLRRGIPRADRPRILDEMRDPANVHVQVHEGGDGDGDGSAEATARGWLQLPGRSESSTNVELVREGGIWRISGLGV